MTSTQGKHIVKILKYLELIKIELLSFIILGRYSTLRIQEMQINKKFETLKTLLNIGTVMVGRYTNNMNFKSQYKAIGDLVYFTKKVIRVGKYEHNCFEVYKSR